MTTEKAVKLLAELHASVRMPTEEEMAEFRAYADNYFAGRLSAAQGIGQERAMETKSVLKGFAIVVADRGFVYVGDVVHDGEWCIVTNARNVRRWGTTKGLGELAMGGPTKDTTMDVVGTVRIPARAVISVIDTDGAKWTCK